MPWLALPFMDRRWRILDRIFEVSTGNLAIVEPGKKTSEEYGADIILLFGIEAYPFTRERLAEIEMVRLKSLTLQSILAS